MSKQRIAIIGAGPSGIAALRAFESAKRAGADIPDIVCYEKQEDWGGQWNYTWRTGLDQYGEPVHSSMYRNLWSNAPKEALEFSEYTFDEHFGKPISSYPPREVLWDYIDGRMRSSNAKSKVKFNTAVRWVEHDTATDTFEVTVEDLTTQTTTSSTFDQVIVSTGHFSFPNVPSFKGIETFPGVVMHAHDFRGAEAMADQRILMIGSSYSAEDIGVQAYKMGARHVTLSYRTQPIGIDWPTGMEELPLVDHFNGNTAHFSDGSVREFDTVILCTGYIHKYPFLPSELSLNSPNNVYPAGLYRGVTFQKNPKLHYLGAQDQWFTYNMFDAQAWYVRDLIMGRTELPTEQQRAEDISQWTKRFEAIDSVEAEIRFQADYIRDLIEQTDYPMFNLDDVVEIFLQWLKDKNENILAYRDKPHRSVVTGTMAVEHHTPWMQEMDDSLERFMSTPQRDSLESILEEETTATATKSR